MIAKIRSKNGFKLVDLNRRKAIRQKCLDCSCWSHSEVRDCSSTDCYLHPFRMGKGKHDAKARAKAIRRHCLECCAESPTEIRKCVSTTCPLFSYRRKQLDRSVNIALLSKKAHIEPLFETKTIVKGQSPLGSGYCSLIGRRRSGIWPSLDSGSYLVRPGPFGP